MRFIFKLRSIQELTLLLNKHREKNFIRFNGHKEYETSTLKHLYVECERQMWQVNKRTFPYAKYFT